MPNSFINAWYNPTLKTTKVSNNFLNFKLDIQGFIPGSRVILFGSMAKGDIESGNDIDLLVISPNDVTPNTKMDLEAKMHKYLVRKYFLPFDVLLYSEAEVEKKKGERA